MAAIAVSRTVRAPIGRVWQVFTDIANAPEHMSGIVAVEMLSGDQFGPGLRWRETRRIFGRDAAEEMWVSDVAEPSHYEVEAESRGTKYASRFEFVEVPGGTRVDLTFTGTPISTVSKMMDKALAVIPKRLIEKSFAKDLDDLAAVCERGG